MKLFGLRDMVIYNHFFFLSSSMWLTFLTLLLTILVNILDVVIPLLIPVAYFTLMDSKKTYLVATLLFIIGVGGVILKGTNIVVVFMCLGLALFPGSMRVIVSLSILLSVIKLLDIILILIDIVEPHMAVPFLTAILDIFDLFGPVLVAVIYFRLRELPEMPSRFCLGEFLFRFVAIFFFYYLVCG